MKSLHIAVAAGLCMMSARAAEYFVDDDNFGKTGMTGASEALAFGTLQEGIDAATAENDIVTVLPGSYTQGGRADAKGNLARGVIETCRIVVRGKPGRRDDTVIYGERDANTGTNGPAAVRGIFIGENADGTIIKGLTINRGTSKAGVIGGGVVYENSDTAVSGVWVSDCAFVDCLAKRGGAAARINVHRCLFFDNHANEQASCGYALGKVMHCVFAGNRQTELFNYCKDTFVNCTFYYNENSFFYSGCTGVNVYNCLALRNSKEIGRDRYVNELCNYVTDRTDANTTRTSGTGNLFEQEAYQQMAPALDDFRLIEGSAALTAGKADYLSLVTLPGELENMDYAGNSLDGLTGAIAAGAVQDSGRPASGLGGFYAAVRGTDYSTNSIGYFVEKSGKRLLDGHVYTETWPVQLELSILAPGRKVWGVNHSSSYTFFPDAQNRLSVILPPSSVTAEYSWKVELAGAELKVDPSGADGAYTTLQAAVDAAAGAGSGIHTYIQAAAGEYRTGGAELNGLMSRVAVNGKYIRLVGAGRGRSFIVGAPDPATADGIGPGATRCVAMSGGVSAVEGFTLTAGCSGLAGTADGEGGGWGAGVSGSSYYRHYLIDSEITAVTGAYHAAAVNFKLLRCKVHDVAAVKRGIFYSSVINACQCERFSSPASAESADSFVNDKCLVYFSTIVGDGSNPIVQSSVKSYFSIYGNSSGVELLKGNKSRGVFFHRCGEIDNQSGTTEYRTDNPGFSDAAASDYRLREDSPAIDAFAVADIWKEAWSNVGTDYAGNPVRIRDGMGTCGCWQSDFQPPPGLRVIVR